MLLEGIFAAVPTPFYPDESVYWRKLEFNIARYSRTLLSGIVVLGSTGEAVMLNETETREVLRLAAGAASQEKVLLAGIARESVKATLELADAAAAFGYDAVLVRTPMYYGPQLTLSAVLHYYRAVADRSPLPVVLYSIPRFTHYELPVEGIAELANHPNIIGIKDSSGSLERVAQILAATRNAPRRAVTVTPIFEAVTGRMLARTAGSDGPATFVSAGDLAGGSAVAVAPPVAPLRTRTKQVGFQVLPGAAATVKESLDLGAHGAVLAFAACAPQACQEIFTAWKENDFAIAAEKQRRIVTASQIVAGDLGIAGIKYACDWNGYFGGYPRAPLLPLTAHERSEVERAMVDIRN